MRFEWVGLDGGYGKEPAFLRALDDMNEVFVADVHRTQRIWTERPGLAVPAAPAGPRAPDAEAAAIGGTGHGGEAWSAGSAPSDWMRCDLRDSTRGPLQVELAHRRVWVWDGEEDARLGAGT